MAKDDKGGKDAGGIDPKSKKGIQKASDDYGDTVADLRTQLKQMSNLLDSMDKTNDSILKAMQNDDQKQMLERMKVLQDTQTKIFEIHQDVTMNKAKAADKAFKAMDKYIRS